jgi:hypothetical protein
MAYLALRGSGAVNGVSRLHGQVSRGFRKCILNRTDLRRLLDENFVAFVEAEDIRSQFLDNPDSLIVSVVCRCLYGFSSELVLGPNLRMRQLGFSPSLRHSFLATLTVT